MTMDKSVLETTRYLPWLTLQEMCLLRIVTTLCNNSQLLGLILECDFETDRSFRLWARNCSGWEEVEAAAGGLLSKLCNNAFLKRKMMKFLWPVAHRIIRWKYVYAESIDNMILRKICWTDRGRVDNIRTARCLVGNKNICVRKRFILACCVCIEDEIRDIWREMPNEDKEYFYAENYEPTRPLVLFWTHFMDGSDDVFKKYIEGARACAIELNLLEVIKYLSAVFPTYKVDMTAHCVIELEEKSNETDCLEEDEKDLVYSIFFEMNEEAQKDIFLNCTQLVLSLLLHSSEYTLCLRLFAERLEHTTEFHIIQFLSWVFYTYNLAVVDDDDCGQLFMEVWRFLPAAVRASIGDTVYTAEFLSVLVRDHFPFLLEEGASEKIADQNSQVHQGKWKFLHFLLEEKVTTTPHIMKFRNQILDVLKPNGFITTAWKNLLYLCSNLEIKFPGIKK